MKNTYTLNSETWIDLHDGTPEEIHSLMDTYRIHPFVAKELTSATPKPRVESHDGYLYCILHFPVWKHTHSQENGQGKTQEVDFIIGKNILITARYDTIDALHKLGKDLEVESVLTNGEAVHAPTLLFIRMLRELYKSVFEELEYIENVVEDITANIFKEKGKEMVVSISEVTRTLLDFKRTTDLHHEILQDLQHKGEVLLGSEFASHMEKIIEEYSKINSTIKSKLEILRDLRETDDSLLNAKQNRKMTQLTVIGSILLILGIIATLWADKF